ncbi:hypothetical protein DPEC_G00334240 [Dallia pectoralis]|uniref:Uncharacterized protein n=1 Tax=Dallia pectoralis TaxID=75939 RepID=A0ACC2F6R2_DALPE|nr:hypothetical protein DPEC_G00334240 [Dallia pectoralis]
MEVQGAKIPRRWRPDSDIPLWGRWQRRAPSLSNFPPRVSLYFLRSTSDGTARHLRGRSPSPTPTNPPPASTIKHASCIHRLSSPPTPTLGWVPLCQVYNPPHTPPRSPLRQGGSQGRG